MVPSHLPNHNKRCTPALRLHVREVMFVLCAQGAISVPGMRLIALPKLRSNNAASCAFLPPLGLSGSKSQASTQGLTPCLYHDYKHI